MSLKTIILVIIASVLIGAGIFYGSRIINSQKSSTVSSESKNQTNTKKMIYPSEKPFPAPSYPAVDSSTNLKSALENAAVPDFSADYENLEKEINSQ